MNAGTRKASARIHASGLAKQAAEKPNIGTNTSPMSERAIISATPANIAKPEKPIPCMVKRTVFTRTAGCRKMHLSAETDDLCDNLCLAW